jgi:uncharacterized membrane protein
MNDVAPLDSESIQSHRSPRAFWAAMLLLVCGGGWLRFAHLNVHSLWYDEACSIYLAEAEDPINALRLDRQPPLFVLLLRWWMRVVGKEDDAVRALSALGGVLCIALSVGAAKVLSRRAALFAVGLIAFAPFSVWYSLEVRGYVFLELSSVAALCIVPWVVALQRVDFLALMGAVVVGVIAPGVHYVGFFVVLFLLVSSLVLWSARAICRRSAIRLAVAPMLGCGNRGRRRPRW